MANEAKKAPEGGGGGRGAGDAAVLKRAQRMSRAMLRPIAEALGLPSDFRREDLEGLVQDLKQKRESGMGDEEKRKAAEDAQKREMQKLQQKLDAAELRASRAEKANEQLEADKLDLTGQLAEAKADAEISVAAANAGVVDLDYAKTLLRREAEKLTEEPGADFVPKFFENLKKDPTKKLLFKEGSVMAGPTAERPETGAGAGGAGAGVGAGAGAGAGGAGGAGGGNPPRAPIEPKPADTKPATVDGMDRRQFNAHLRNTHGFVPGM